jgi:hypothetical protein
MERVYSESFKSETAKLLNGNPRLKIPALIKRIVKAHSTNPE